MARITKLDVRRVVDAMASHLAPATVRTSYGVLTAVFSAAVEAEIIAKTPCRGISLPTVTKRECPTSPTTRTAWRPLAFSSTS